MLLLLDDFTIQMIPIYRDARRIQKDIIDKIKSEMALIPSGRKRNIY
jgi:hypothetical protein